MKTIFNNTIYIKAISIAIVAFFIVAKAPCEVVNSAYDETEYPYGFLVSVDGQSINVYECKVPAGNASRRDKANMDKVNSHLYYDLAAFTVFSLADKELTVNVSVPNTISSAKILPESANIGFTINENSLSFKISKAQNLTVEINGEYIKSLHIFANPPETDAPDINASNVKVLAPGQHSANDFATITQRTIYFAPGEHELSGYVTLRNNKTIYLAEGAYIRAKVAPNEPSSINSYGLHNYNTLIALFGNNVAIKGRGIIDGTDCPNLGKHLFYITNGSNVEVKDIIILNPSPFALPIRNSSNVLVDNVKIIGSRCNSDGIDIIGGKNVTVQNCFLRTLDDLIVIKTYGDGKEPGNNILVQNCVLWNGVAHALSLGAELQSDIDGVTFRDCDIIRNPGTALKILHSGTALLKNITFEDIRVDEARTLVDCWIGKDGWSRPEDGNHSGNVRDVLFKNITAKGDLSLLMRLAGYRADYTIENVTFENVTRNERPLTMTDITINPYVKNVVIRENSAGISTVKKADWVFYPNPVTENLHIENASNISKVEIYNIAGSLVKSIKNINGNIDSIEMGNLIAGTYLVLIHTEQGLYGQNIIKN